MSHIVRLAYAAALFAALIPCFWQLRIQAGDLSSHIYNAWLVKLIHSGQAPGLTVATQTTNVLFDWMLSAFLSAGAGVAQHIAVGIAVLAFVSGAFAFVRVISGRLDWEMLGFVLPLAYGWVFHIGFFNFYLSLGLCFWALALAWNLTPRGLAMAAPFLVVAYLAHALPVLWVVGVLGFVWLARSLGPARSTALLGGSMAAILVLRVVSGSLWTTHWYSQQFLAVTGMDQLVVYDDKYIFPAAILLLLAALRASRLFRAKAGLTIPVQVLLLTAAGAALLPGSILLPGYKHSLAFIAERMSLAIGVLVCALIAASPARKWERYATLAIAALFFVFLYKDEAALNTFESRLFTLIDNLSANQRVITGVDAPGLRINVLAHMIDRVCVKRCYSYANYEPSTNQFRVRVTGENPIVAATYEDSFALQVGTYLVKPHEIPMYQVLVDAHGNLGIRELQAGLPNGMTYWNPL